jgi:hypothetical protein
MHSAWLRFAATGAPGNVEGVDWLTAKDGILELGDTVRMRDHWREDSLDFVKNYQTVKPRQ